MTEVGIREFIQSARRLRYITTRPSRDEVWLILKISFLGILIIGGIGFAIKILFLTVGLLPSPS